MKAILLSAVFLLSLLASPSFGQEVDIPQTRNPDGSITLTIPKEMDEQCQAGGGCILVSRQAVLEALQQSCGLITISR